MPFSNSFVISARVASLLFILLVAFSFEIGTFTYKSIFVGLLFSHFAYGLYYEKNNVKLMRHKKGALIIATTILIIGLYFSLYQTHLAPYFLVVHAALSDAYLLNLKTKLKDPERMALLRSVFYTIGFALIFVKMSPAIALLTSIAGLVCFLTLLSITEDKKTLTLFEIPLLVVAGYMALTNSVLHIHFLGFYHILTWYIFSFWMLFMHEKSAQKTISFFAQIFIVSAIFVVLFDQILNISITDESFMKIIGTWSILHIFSSIPLSKFNPRFLKNLFYT